jgi:hypothetical protein
VRAFARAAVYTPILTLVDFMDTQLPCPPQVAREWLGEGGANLMLRVVVPEIESWLLADRIGIASFLGVARERIPLQPESLENPKQTLVNLARRSSKRSVREALVPAPRTTALVGPLYNSELSGFVTADWDPGAAAEEASSLARCLARLRDLG